MKLLIIIMICIIIPGCATGPTEHEKLMSTINSMKGGISQDFQYNPPPIYPIVPMMPIGGYYYGY